MKGNYLYVIIFAVSLLVSCKADMICPAYQSYFLLDENAQKNQFAYFAQDSLPRKDLFHTTSDKNGLVAKTSLFEYINKDWSRNRELKTVPMTVVYPELSDSLLFSGDALMLAETDVVDTAALDSARLAAQTFQYNVDQKYYNWYFRGKLVWQDELDEDKEAPEAKDNIEKKGIFSFIKNLFKKKDKEPVKKEEPVTNNYDITQPPPAQDTPTTEAENKPPIEEATTKEKKKKKEKKPKKKKNKKPGATQPAQPDKQSDDTEDDGF